MITTDATNIRFHSNVCGLCSCHGFALSSDNCICANYTVNVLKRESIWNANINCILGFAEKTTISAASTQTTSILFNETSSAPSTGRPTSAVSLESTAVTSQNATGMTIDQCTAAEHKWQHIQSYYCKLISVTYCQICALLDCWLSDFQLHLHWFALHCHSSCVTLLLEWSIKWKSISTTAFRYPISVIRVHIFVFFSQMAILNVLIAL